MDTDKRSKEERNRIFNHGLRGFTRMGTTGWRRGFLQKETKLTKVWTSHRFSVFRSEHGEAGKVTSGQDSVFSIQFSVRESGPTFTSSPTLGDYILQNENSVVSGRLELVHGLDAPETGT